MDLVKDGDVDKLNTFIGLTKDLITIVKAQADLLQLLKGSIMPTNNWDITYLANDGHDIIKKLELLISPPVIPVMKKYRKKILTVSAYQFKMPNPRSTRPIRVASKEQPGVLWKDFGSSIMHPYCQGNGFSEVHVYDKDWIVFERGFYTPVSPEHFDLFYMEDK